jgi:hypothetical protein
VSGDPARAGRGRTAAVPDGFYQQPPTVELPEDGGAPVVRFTGEDGRECVFRFEELPLEGLHRDFAHALGARIGPGGGRRTQRAAASHWQSVKRFFLLLDQLPAPPGCVEELRVRHLQRYLMTRRQTCSEKSARKNLQDLLLLMRALPTQDRLDSQVADFVGQRGHGVDAQQAGQLGYSDREFQAIMAAARSDVVAIRDRIAAGEALLQQFMHRPGLLSVADRKRDTIDARPPAGTDPVAALHILLDDHRCRGQRLPAAPPRLAPARRRPEAFPSVSHLARLLGFPKHRLNKGTPLRIIGEAARDLGVDTDCPLTHSVRGQLEGRPWLEYISYYEAGRMERLLQVSCWIVIAYLSGMRDSEIKHLKRGCVNVQRAPDGHVYRYRLHSLAFKGEEAHGVAATWIVTAPVARAIAVLERLQPDEEPYLFAKPPSSPSHRQRQDQHHVPGSSTTIKDMAALITWINAYCLAHHRPDRIPADRGRQPRLTTRQFRRTLAWSSPAAPAVPSPAPCNTATSASRCSRATPAPATPASATRSRPKTPSPEASTSPRSARMATGLR